MVSLDLGSLTCDGVNIECLLRVMLKRTSNSIEYLFYCAGRVTLVTPSGINHFFATFGQMTNSKK